MNIILKRSNLGYIPFPVSDRFIIKRAITTKEAFTKASKAIDTDAIIIEAAEQKDLTTAIELLDKLNIGNALIILLTEQFIEFNEAELNQLRALLINNQQLIWEPKYKAGVEYGEIFNDIENVWLPAFKDAQNNKINEQTKAQVQTTDQQKEERDLKAVAQLSYVNSDTANETILQLEYQVNSLKEELRLAKKFISEMTENTNISLTVMGGAETTRLYDENNSLKEEVTRLTELQKTFDDLNSQIAELSITHEQDALLTSMWKTLLEGLFDYSEEIESAGAQAEQILQNAAEAAGTTQARIKELETKVNEQDEQITKLSELNAEQQETIAELHVDLNTAVEAGERLQAKNDELDNILTRLQEEKRKLSVELGEKTSEIAKLSTYDISQLRQLAKDGGNVQQILEEKMRTAKETLHSSEAKNRTLSKELANARTLIENLTREKRILEGMLDGENYGGAALTWLTPVQARIWSFIGHGGQGCTTAAHAVAQRLYELNKSVIIIDCDFRAPKQHVLCKVDPCITYTKFTNITTELRTSLGKLLTNGSAVYAEFDQEMTIVVKEDREHRLDLLSGLLSVRAASEVASLDLNTLCVHLAKRYDYIIIDLGRAEGNGGIARQQSIIMKNSNRRFIVTTNELENVKSAVNRLLQAGITIENAEFIFDLVQERPDKNLQQITKRVRQVWEIPFDKKMIGKALPMAVTGEIRKIVAYELGK